MPWDRRGLPRACAVDARACARVPAGMWSSGAGPPNLLTHTFLHDTDASKLETCRAVHYGDLYYSADLSDLVKVVYRLSVTAVYKEPCADRRLGSRSEIGLRRPHVITEVLGLRFLRYNWSVTDISGR